MRPSRIFRLTVRMILLVLTLSMSIVSTLGGYSAILILDTSQGNNIEVPDGDMDYYLNISTDEEREKNYFEFPYKINNVGYFDLTDMELDLTIYFEYESNRTGDKEKLTLAEKTEKFDDTPAGSKLKDEFKLKADDFEDIDYAEIESEITIDLAKLNDTIIWYTADIEFSARYSLELLEFRIELYDVSVYKQDLGEFLGI